MQAIAQSNVCPFRWDEQTQTLSIIDQLALPQREHWIPLHDVQQYANAITDMVVRGAPAIGITAAFGFYTSATKHWAIDNRDEKRARILADKAILAATRPTAVNLFWALDRMARALHTHLDDATPSALLREAFDIWHEDVDMNKKMAAHGADAIGPIQNILTHCNAGALATGGLGTALGVIREIHARQARQAQRALQAPHQPPAPIHVWVDETRPYLQGARLTAWELLHDDIDCTLITDSTAAHLMQQKLVDAIIVGADRIAQNFDVANKIGTYALAILANYHHIPFYVAAPDSTFDPVLKTGSDIAIEQRSQDEVKRINGQLIAPPNANARHYAFDVTPHTLITAIITPNGIIQPNKN